MSKKELIQRLEAEGFPDEILNAFKKVKRERFISKELKNYAYDDTALPLEGGATISQPSTIAFMLDLLEIEGNEKVLEIGSGSGYVLLLLSNLTKNQIYGVEIKKSLAKKSKKIIKNKRIQIVNKNGSNGLKENAPFDRIIISASSESIPSTLYSQLKNNGILVCPVKNSIFQIKKLSSGVEKKEFPGFIFVSME